MCIYVCVLLYSFSIIAGSTNVSPTPKSAQLRANKVIHLKLLTENTKRNNQNKTIKDQDLQYSQQLY